MTLRISLRDGERVVVNGAVLRAVGRTDLCVEGKASILRGREIMGPEDANTPAKQLYFLTMMAYIDPDGAQGYHDRIVEALQQVAEILPAQGARAATVSYARHVAHMQFYRALTDCRTLIALEADILADTAAAA